MYRRSIDDRDAFFAEMADAVPDWDQPWRRGLQLRFHPRRGELVRRRPPQRQRELHRPPPAARADQTAIIWEGDDPADSKHISYRELQGGSLPPRQRAPRARRRRGDRVCLYMPMIPEAAYAMLACARIGAVHTVVFGGFSPEALKDRIQSAECCALITADEGCAAARPCR
jgi:acetyl-CoA synthetase